MLSKKVKKVKKPRTGLLIKKLDALWSEIVKLRAGRRCEVCGESSYLNAHHYVSRSNRRLRWELYNGVAVCPKHHTFANESFHRDPVWGGDWMEDNREDNLIEIENHRQEIAKWCDADLEEKIIELKKLLNKFESKEDGRS